jgi:hypothetical protein
MKLSSSIWLQRKKPQMPNKVFMEGAAFYARRLKELGYDDCDEVSFSLLAGYCSRYNANRSRLNAESEYALPERGLLLFGEHGLGKSEFLKRFSAMMEIELIDARDIAWEFQVGGAAAVDAMLRPFNHEDLIIDDIGNEDEAKSFGNSFSMATIIDKRYRLWSMPNGVRTFFASNASRAALQTIYGAATLSRIQGMCDVVQFSGFDRRLER